jgi:hypothetical protein
MALDPALIAALTSGATSGAKTSSTVGSSGIDWSKGSVAKNPSGWNLGQSLIDILSTLTYSSAGITNKIGQNVAAIQRGEIGGALDLLNPLSVPGAIAKGIEERRTYSDNLRDMGMEGPAATWLGLALDIGLDPTTYLTGGAVAGIKGAAAGARLAGAANKADSILARDVPEAIANNLPDLSRPFIPTDAGLTQGQKLGNYLTGVLRGYEFNKSTYAANKANKKITKTLLKDLEKDPKNLALANEVLGVTKDGKRAAVNLTDNRAQLNREAFMRAVANSEVLQAKFAPKMAKYEKAAERAAAAKFTDPRTLEKLNPVQAAQAAKGAQAAGASDVDTISAAARIDEASVTDNPAQIAITDSIAAERVFNESSIAERLAAEKAVKAADKKALRKLSNVQTKYDEISTQIMDVARRVVDPETGVRLSQFEGTKAELVDRFSELLSNGKLKLTPERTAQFARILNVSSDAQQTVIDQTHKTLVRFSADLREVEVAREQAAQLARALESKFKNATPDAVAAVTGAGDSVKVGEKLEDAMQIEQEVANNVNDAVNNAFFDTPSTASKTAEELKDNATDLRATPAEQIVDDIDYFKGSRFTSFKGNITAALNNAIGDGPWASIEAFAKARNQDPIDLVSDAYFADKAVLNDDAMTLSEKSIRLDMLNTEARFATFNRVWQAVGKNVDKNARLLGESVEEEARILRVTDNMFRMLGVPVRVRENILMQLRRDGQKMVGDPLSKNFKPYDLNVTYADIALTLAKAGKANIMGALRFPGKLSANIQNVMPSNFEYAFMKIAQLKQSGQTIVKGSDAWDEVLKAFNESYEFGGEGVKLSKKVPVDEFFKPAKHLEPSVVEKGGKKVQLKKIQNLEAKTDAVIEAMVDASDELLDIHAARAAAYTADVVAEVMPDVRLLFSDLIDFWGTREKFLSGAPELLTAGRGALAGGARGVPGFNAVKTRLKKLITGGAKTAAVFRDPDIAKEVSEMLINMFMKSMVGGTAGSGPFGDLPPNTKQELVSFITNEVAKLRHEITTEINLVNATGVTRPSTKLSPKQTQDGMNARRTVVEARQLEVGELTSLAVNTRRPAVEEQARQAAAAGAKASDETSTVADNLISDNDDEFIAEMENIVTAQLADSANLTFSGRMRQRFDPTFGIGEGVKTLTTGIESFSHNSVGYFNDALISLFNKHGKDIVAVNKGFKVLQDWGKEQLKNVDLGLPEIPLNQWLQSAKLGDTNQAIVEDFGMMVEELFGVDGVSSGVMSDAILRPYFGDELNVMFSTRGFWESDRVGGKAAKMKTAFKLPPGLNEKGVKYSWANADLNDKYNSISFLSEYADSMHAVQTRIAIGESFSLHHGKTYKQIKEEGLDEANYVRIDQQDEFGKYIDPNKLFDAADVEKMQFLKDYVTYKKSFSGAMQRIVDMSDRITAFLKPSHTTWRLGHHVTTVIGEEIMNKLAGVNKISYYHNGVRILKKFDPSMYKGDENIFRTYAEMSSPGGMTVKAEDFDGVKYINSETGKVTFLPDEAIAAAMERYGVAVRMGSGTVEDLELTGLGELRGGIVSGVSKINKKLGKFSSHRDNFFRAAHFIKEIEQGGPYASFEEAAIAAARKVHEWHPTTYGLSAFERKNMRRAVFFYTWQRIAATKVFELMLNAPGVVTIPSKIQYAFAEANGFAPESFGRPWDPNGLYASWDTSNLYGPQFQGPAGKGDAWGFGPAIPQLDILNGLFGGFTVQPGQTGLDALTKGSQTLAGNNLSPLPKWFAELSTGNRVGTGGDIRNPLEYAIDQVGGINTLSRLTGIGRDPNTNVTPTEEAEQKARTLINWFTGQKLKDYSTGQSLGQWKRDQSERIRRLTGQD